MKKILSTLILLAITFAVAAQDDSKSDKYRRSSIYSLMVSKPNTKFGKEITEAYIKIPIPEKYNDHNLSVRVISSKDKKEDEPNINNFLSNNAVARRIVGRWFDRDPSNGICNLKTIGERGLYDATYYDAKLSSMSARGSSILADAGEDLIANSFVLVNDIRYVDKEQNAKVWGGVIRLFGAVAAAYVGDNSLNTLANSISILVEQIKGFRVIVESYLYRLDWNTEVADKFYSEYYMSEGENSDAKIAAFNNDNSTFKLSYIGKQRVDSGETSFIGVNLDTPDHMIRKVCARAIDKSIVELQSNYEVFRVKIPIHTISPYITAKVGVKEGVTPQVKFEVLEKFIDRNDRMQYKRIGVIQPVEGMIWDNRYMASEENAIGAGLGVTTFRKVSGGRFMEGMLIRQIK